MKINYLKITVSLIVNLLMINLSGCSKSDNDDNSSSEISGKKVTLNMQVSFLPTESVMPVLRDIADNFNKENPNIEVQVSSLPDYEGTMKIKMAANDLPDIFTTHGWSLTRYSQYLIPLQNETWAKNLNPLLKPKVTNSNGELFVLPANVNVTGIVFNKDVLDEAGVNPDIIKTWDDFKVACEKIKVKGKTPIELGGVKDDWTVGAFFDYTATSFLITNESKNYRSQLLDGTFDWKNYEPVYNLFNDCNNAGYFNKDAKEGTFQGATEAFANGTAGFSLLGNSMLADAMKINPEGNYGFMPFPAATADDSPTIISGEDKAFGVWKDSKHKTEALKFLEYMAKPENINKIAETSLAPAGLVGDGYKTKTGKLSKYYDNLKNTRAFGFFDRVYLPNGMWDSMVDTGIAVLFGEMNADEVSDKLKADYDKLMEK